MGKEKDFEIYELKNEIEKIKKNVEKLKKMNQTIQMNMIVDMMIKQEMKVKVFLMDKKLNKKKFRY